MVVRAGLHSKSAVSVDDGTNGNASRSRTAIHGAGLNGVLKHYCDVCDVMTMLEEAAPKVRLPKCLAGNVAAGPAPVAPQAELLAMLSTLDGPTMELMMQTMRRFTEGARH